jgi:NTE family protein
MRWNVPVSLLLLGLAGCAPAKFVCGPATGAAALADPTPEMVTEACELPAAGFDFENLVIEGGGAKGIAYGGALEVLTRAKILGPGSTVRRVAGTSAGSITAVLIALGYTPGEVRSLLMDLDLEKLKDDGSPVRLVEEFGYYSGEFYLSWMQCQVKGKTGDPNTNFLELHRRNQASGLPDLYVVTTDLTHSRWQVLSHETAPCMPVAEAARLSGSLPFFFNAPRVSLDAFQTVDGACPKTPRSGAVNVFSDGGLLLNYPMPLFDTAFFVNGGSPDAETINPRTLGLHLDPPRQDQVPAHRIGSLPDYAKAVAEAAFATQVEDFEHNPCDIVRSVRIDDLGIATTEFNLTRDQKLALIRSGFRHTCRYLQAWSPENLQKACPSGQPFRTPRLE